MFIIRHGETVWNALQLIQGRQNIPLNAKGREQAYEKAIQFKDQRIDYIGSSPSERTSETASIISRQLNIPCYLFHELSARSYGPWEGESIESIQVKFHDLLMKMRSWSLKEIFLKSPLEVIESYQAVSKRVFILLRNMICRHPNQNGLFITHGGVITSLLLALQIPSEEIPLISQEGYVEISFSEDRFRVEKVVGLIQPDKGNQSERVILF